MYYVQGIMPWNNGFYGYFTAFKSFQNIKEIRHECVSPAWKHAVSMGQLLCAPYCV